MRRIRYGMAYANGCRPLRLDRIISRRSGFMRGGCYCVAIRRPERESDKIQDAAWNSPGS